jgi:MYXO-CTERM domain-containing protein
MKLMSFAAAAALFMPGAEALACGGFMCDQAQPVMQNAERIVFGVDEEGGVDMHVQVSYEGPSENFAWILPVPGEPEIFLSIDTLFSTLAVATAPLFTLNRIDEGTCRNRNGGLFGGSNEVSLSMSDSGGSDPTDDGVTVVAQAQVGPYDTVTLQANSADELLDWLQANGYDLPDGLDSALSPYVAEDSYFVALKLLKDKDDGDIAPVGLHFQSDSTSIPIQLTSIAATPDMVLEVYVFGNERAVPESYLHVQINDAAIDWFNNAQNYSDVITMAADEAGGHAFATDFSGDAAQFQDRVYYEGQCDVQFLINETDALTFVNNLWWSGCPFSNQMFSVLEAHIPVPSSAGNITAGSFYSCMDCFVSRRTLESEWDFDEKLADALVEDINAFVVEPMKNAEALFEDFSTLSRMTSSLSPVEMTVDPTFVLNPDMGDVDRNHSADLVTECGNGRYRDTAPRRLDLTDGRSIRLPSESWFAANETTESEFLAELGDVNAMIIEVTGASGDPEIIFDYTEDGQIAVDSFNKMVQRLIGCGCATGAEPVGALYLSALLGAAALRRREND